MSGKPRMLVVSHVLPYPGNAGQQMRVLNKLLAFRELFEVTFLTFAPAGEAQAVKEKVEEVVSHAVVMPSVIQRSSLIRWYHRIAGSLYAWLTSHKKSNYMLGLVELSPNRVRNAVEGKHFDIAVYEYWHAYRSAEYLQSMGIPCVVDIHDLLWQSYKRHVNGTALPAVLKRFNIERYRKHEEKAWGAFDAIIAINRAEDDYVKQRLGSSVRTFYAPMGTDLDTWNYQWKPENPPRLAYYGGLGNVYNQKDALICRKQIMPTVWSTWPDAQLWLVGGDPPERLQALDDGERVFVTGFVDDVQSVLKTMSLVLCPFNGTFGFRSRLIEVMALGVPVVASEDAAYGMDLPSGEGIFLCKSPDEIAAKALELLGDSEKLRGQSIAARKKTEELYSFDQSYGRLAKELADYIGGRPE